MNQIKNYTNKMFEEIKHIDENECEFWYARELMPLLEYKKRERFSNAIDNAKFACLKSGNNVDEQFPGVGKLSKRNNRAYVIIQEIIGIC